ncbi:MAG TPA: helix-turn-helix transcriptional regulator [bacterium]|nr:helix-turn-helix transcriptional regulator [bacterium]HPN42151.1 helix-turn-helix transcriptional regulator [bacterium]
MLGKINEIVLFITVFLFFLFTIFLLTRTENKTTNRLLAAFLLAKLICIINILLYFFYNYFFSHFPNLFYILWPFLFVYIPLLYLYTRSIVYPEIKITVADLKYFAVFVIAVLFFSIRFYFLDANAKRLLLEDSNFHQQIGYLFLILYYPQSFFFLVASLVMLYRYRQRIRQYYSSLEKINLSWLSIVLWSFIIMYSIALLDDLSRFTGIKISLLELLLNCSFLVFPSILIFKGLSLSSEPTKINLEEKTKPVGLDDTLLTAYTNRLQHYMQHEKPYLYSTITLQDLADKLSVPPRNLSYLLNNYIKQNFFDYINSYRIEEAKQIMQKHNRPKTILEVLYSVGFNSKSVFNTAFKKNTGMTPSEFIKYLEKA